MIGFTKSCAKEFAASGITVNAIAPGFIATDMTDELSDKVKEAIKANIPMRKFGEVDDIAEAWPILPPWRPLRYRSGADRGRWYGDVRTFTPKSYADL